VHAAESRGSALAMDIRAFLNKAPTGAAVAWHTASYMCAGGCEMTPDLEPLPCRCGDHSAKCVPATKKQPSHGMVMSVKVQGQKPWMVTNVTSKEKALERVRAGCAPAAAHTATADPEVLNESNVTADGPEVHPLVPAS
jgi:hypothetical protein